MAILERTVEGGDLISLATIKEHLKVTTTTADNDTLLTAMVLAMYYRLMLMDNII